MSLHSKTKKYATYGKKSKSRVVEIDGVSGRSNFSSYDQWSDYSRPATSNSIANKENVASHQSAAIPNSAKRNGSTPFSTDLLARYVLSKPQPAKSIPRSPLAKQQQGKKPPKRLDADSDDSFEDQDSNEKGPLSLTNATKGDPPPPVSTATTSKRQSNRKSTKTSQPEHERVETEEHDEDSVILISPLKSTAPSARAVASYPSTSCSKAPSARQLSRERNVSPSPVRQPIAKLHPEQMTPFEIVPPTPSAVRKSRSVKVKSSSRRSAALRVRPINESLTSSKSAATSGKKQPPPAPKRPSAPDAIIIDEVPDSEMEAVKPRKSKTTSRPPAKRKAPSIETDSVDDDWLPQQIRPTVPANPFYASTPHKPAPPASSSRIVPHAESDRHPTPVKSLHVQHDQEPKTPSQGGIKRSNLKVAPAIQPLLQACGQAAAYDFSSFIDQTAQPNDSCSDVKMSWKKLGEATYSEIFVRVHNCDDAPKSRQLYDDDVMVVKVVPIHLPKPRRSKKKVSQSDEEERPEETSVEDALRELTVTRLMNEDDPGGSFISLLGGHIVQGVYPQRLLREWQTFKNSEPVKAINHCPDAFNEQQYFLILCLPYGGLDLETFKLRSWTHAASIVWQVTYGLATAERGWRFEHRDLHWGNVLVRECPTEDDRGLSVAPSSTFKSPLRRPTAVDQRTTSWPACLEPEASGIKCCIIDYSLSSCDDAQGRRLHGGLEDDAIFEGDGDYQFDVYRMMRRATNSNWSGFYPLTNLMWLHYLIERMLKHKGLRPPAPSKSKHPHVTSLGGHKIYGRSRGGLVSQHRLQDQDQQHSQTERRAFDALVLSEQVLRAVINQGENEEVVHSSNHADAMGLPELRDSESFLTWFSVVPN